MSNIKQSLIDLLSNLGESARFATSGDVPPVLPGLEVQGVGPIGLPLNDVTARALIAQATQAPYGKGEETIVDTNVRRVWQVGPSAFSLTNPAWDDLIATVVETVRTDLGVKHKVRADLYKLLIYERGSFFAPHRDTEKVPGMFATLVVCLPSKHQGGQLIVSHDGQTVTIDFGGEGRAFQTRFAAFFADCQHEVLPVTSGHRLCLVYNLVTVGKGKPSAPMNAGAVEQTAILLRAFFEQEADAEKLAVPFQHQYTQAGLSPDQLKGTDRARADVLSRAAESLGYECHFALLTDWKTGEADYNTLPFDPFASRWRRGREGPRDYSGVRIEEVYEEKMSLAHWMDPQGRAVALGEVGLTESEVLSGDDRQGWSFKQEVHEATGNEGVSVERWYCQGAIVVWPPDRKFGILADKGPAGALPELERMAGLGARANIEDCRAFAEAIIRHWHKRASYAEEQDRPTFCGRMLAVLEKVGTADLVDRFIRSAVSGRLAGGEGPALARLAARHGWGLVGDALLGLLEQRMTDNHKSPAPLVQLCAPLASEPPAHTAERRDACVKLGEALARLITTCDETKAYLYDTRDPRAGVIEGLVRFFAACDDAERLDWVMSQALAHPRYYDLRATIVPDLKALLQAPPEGPSARAFLKKLTAHCQDKLREATARPVEPPSDWSRAADFKCDCADCQALAKFLRDPNQREARFPIRKDRRQHLHMRIDQHRCDCTHVTERKGSPQVLVCTKNQASYERRLEQYEADKVTLAELEALASVDAKPKKRASSPKKRPKK